MTMRRGSSYLGVMLLLLALLPIGTSLATPPRDTPGTLERFLEEETVWLDQQYLQEALNVTVPYDLLNSTQQLGELSQGDDDGMASESPRADHETKPTKNQDQTNGKPQDVVNSTITSNPTAVVLEPNNRGEDNTGDSEPSLAVVVTFEEIFRLSVFIAAAWALSNLSQACGLPGLVGEIITGFLLGPPLANFCPFPQAMVLIGNFGLLGLMLESGIHLDIAQLQETGTRAVFMAVSGTLLALGAGLGLWYTNHVEAPEGALLFPSSSAEFSAAMAVGSSFAPSSLGVAAAVLSSGNVLNTPIGQLIVASSVVDDVLGLILLALLNVFAMDDPTIFHYIQPFVASFGFLAVLGYLGVTWIPRMIQDGLLPRIAPENHEKAVFVFMFTLMLIYMPVLNYAGASYLTGAFLAGLSVSQVPNIQESYKKNGQEIMVWLMRMFFSATIGFQIPILRYGSFYVLTLAAKFSKQLST